MGEIKSAWEIAQEKAQKLGKLSAEEIRKERAERGSSTGRALAEKYLVKPDLRELTEVLGNWKGEEEKIIRQAAVIRLVEAIELKSDGKLKDVNQGISALLPGDRILNLLKEIENLFEEYEQAEQTVKQQVDRAGREILHQLRISGTAIGDINPEVKEEWQRALAQFAHPFEGRLNSLKQELLGKLNSLSGYVQAASE